MTTVHVYSNGDDWTVVVMNGKRMYAGHEPIGPAFEELMKYMGVKVVRHWGTFVEGDDTRFVKSPSPVS